MLLGLPSDYRSDTTRRDSTGSELLLVISLCIGHLSSDPTRESKGLPHKPVRHYRQSGDLEVFTVPQEVVVLLAM